MKSDSPNIARRRSIRPVASFGTAARIAKGAAAGTGQDSAGLRLALRKHRLEYTILKDKVVQERGYRVCPREPQDGIAEPGVDFGKRGAERV